MIVEFSGKRIKLIPGEVKLAKRLVRKFLESVKLESRAQGALTFYYTLILVMYVMAHDYIESVTPEVIALILNTAAKEDP